jgi:hypothetical protein
LKEVKFGVLSCNKIYHTQKMLKEGKGDLWDQISAFVDEDNALDCLIHIGDQVYADHEWSNVQDGETDKEMVLYEGKCKYTQALELLEGKPVAEWEQHRDKIKELYREVYRETWGHPPTAQALANVANIMIMDDHEIRDDFGDNEEELEPTSTSGYIGKCGYDVYCEYQRALRILPEGHVGTDHYLDLWGGSIGIALVDIRAARSFKRQVGDPTPYLGTKQWSDLKLALSEHGLFAEVQTLVVLAATPLVFYSQSVNDLAAKVVDDLWGQWSSSKNQPEQIAMLDVLRQWKMPAAEVGGGGRELVVVGGDVHIGACTDIFYKGEKLCEQLITSPVANKTFPHVLEIVFKAGASLFGLPGDYSYQHREWENERNFGVITISPSSQATGIDGADMSAGDAGEVSVAKGIGIQLIPVDPTKRGGGCSCVVS